MAAPVIHKYRLPFHSKIRDVVEIQARPGRLLLLAKQGADIHIWVAVDPGTPLRPIKLHLVGTGSEIDLAWSHLGSIIDGSYVWHVFAEPAPGGPPIQVVPQLPQRAREGVDGLLADRFRAP